MKYFAHLCTAQDDDKFDRLFEVYSFEGYGVYWWLCEHVGRRKKTANDNPAYLFASPPRTSRVLERGSRRSRIATIIRFLDSIELIEMEDQGDWLAIKIPKLNNYSAEWQKRLAKKNYGVAPESTPESLPSGLGREVVDVKDYRREEKRSKRSRPPADGGVAPGSEAETTDGIEDPQARAEALKTIRTAMRQIEPEAQRREVVEPGEEGNGTIPTAEGPEVEEKGVQLEEAGFYDPIAQDILNAWWALKQGTHGVFALAGALDKHGVKGQDRSRIYSILGVV